MGTGIGIKCERCGEQLDYEYSFESKEDGYEHNLCGHCVKDREKKEWDEKHKQ